MVGTTGLTGLSGIMSSLPIHAVMTDDPMRARMLASHWLDNAKVLYELRGMIGYTGSYKGASIALLSTGYGESSALMYLQDARLLGMQRVFYMGECVSRIPGIKLRDVILVKGGDASLMQCALSVAEQFAIAVASHSVTTCDRIFLDGDIIPGDIVDFASGAVAEFAAEHGIAAVSVLTVSQNTATGVRIEEHERQSRFNAASQLVFEALAIDTGNSE